jgi:hypothetical protein
MARTEHLSMEARLAAAGRRIDQVASRARDVRDDTRVRVEARVQALRARQAAASSKARVAVEAEAWDEHAVALDRELGEIDAEIAIAVAQLELDAAEDRAAFEAAVQRQIDAYRRYAQRLQGGAGAAGQGQPGRSGVAAASIRERGAAAAERLRRLRAASGEASNSLRAGVLAALDDLDRAAKQARPTRPLTSTDQRGMP